MKRTGAIRPVAPVRPRQIVQAKRLLAKMPPPEAWREGGVFTFEQYCRIRAWLSELASK